jgi:predicted HNH restriction endonuclease
LDRSSEEALEKWKFTNACLGNEMFLHNLNLIQQHFFIEASIYRQKVARILDNDQEAKDFSDAIPNKCIFVDFFKEISDIQSIATVLRALAVNSDMSNRKLTKQDWEQIARNGVIEVIGSLIFKLALINRRRESFEKSKRRGLFRCAVNCCVKLDKSVRQDFE